MGAIVRHNIGNGGHWYEIDGRKADGVTTLLRDGIPKPGLVKWAAESTAGYALDHWDELSEMPLSQRLTQMTTARQAESRRAIISGQRVHQLGRQLAAGQEVDVPDDLAGHVRSYVQFLDEWEPDPLLIEATVANRAVHYAGTLDLLARVFDAESWLFDIKTGNRVYGETALQLAAYAYAECWLDADGNEHPMPEVNAAAIIHVRSDGYSVYRVPLDGQVFGLFRHVAFVARHMPTMHGWIGAPISHDMARL